LPILPTAGALFRQLRLDPRKAAVGELEEDQAKDRDRILGGLEMGVGPQLIRCLPQAVGDVLDVDLRRIGLRYRWESTSRRRDSAVDSLSRAISG
jgi:hypothetical protein